MFDADETINLAGIEYGARIVNYSDCHYSHPENILMPDKGKDMVSREWEKDLSDIQFDGWFGFSDRPFLSFSLSLSLSIYIYI